MTAQSLLAWWNLIFVVPFGLALVYLGLYTLTGVSFGETDVDTDADLDPHAEADTHVDVDADADVGIDADADLDVDADADIDTDADLDADPDLDTDADGHVEADADVGADADADADADSEANVDPDADAAAGSAAGHAHAPFHAAALSFLGVGRVPLSLLLMVLLLTWGASGFVANQVLAERWGHHPRVAAVSIPLAFLAAMLFTRMLVRAIDRWLPLNETSARRRHELLGSVGEALFSIDARFGLAAVRDDRGELYQVPCRVRTNAGPLAKGSRVRLVAYNSKSKSFFVSGFREAGTEELRD